MIYRELLGQIPPGCWFIVFHCIHYLRLLYFFMLLTQFSLSFQTWALTERISCSFLCGSLIQNPRGSPHKRPLTVSHSWSHLANRKRTFRQKVSTTSLNVTRNRTENEKTEFNSWWSSGYGTNVIQSQPDKLFLVLFYRSFVQRGPILIHIHISQALRSSEQHLMVKIRLCIYLKL